MFRDEDFTTYVREEMAQEVKAVEVGWVAVGWEAG